MLLGLGTQVKGHNERRFSVPWGQPTPRLSAYIEMMRAVWDTWRTGEKPRYEGEYYRYTLDSFRFNPGPIDYPDPPIALAAVRPTATLGSAPRSLTAYCGTASMSWDFRDQVLHARPRGRRRAPIGKDPQDLVIAGGGFVFTA